MSNETAKCEHRSAFTVSTTMPTESSSLLDGMDMALSPTSMKKSTSSAGFNAWNLFWGLLGVAIGSALVSSVRNNADKNVVLSHVTGTQSRYKHVQGLGFQIYTGGAPAFLKTNNDVQRKNPECSGRHSYGLVDGEIQCYMGQEDTMDDVQSRVDIMKAAVERAYQLSDKGATTLKVFVAPEFYWRGIDGAYTFEDDEDPNAECGAICHVLRALEDIVAEKRFEDWLFHFGTVIAYETLPKEDEYDDLFYNFAPVYKGYDPAKTDHDGKRFLVPKRYVSSSDFLTPQRFMNSTLAREVIQEPLPEHDTTVFNPFDFEQKRYDSDMWLKYKEELSSLGYAMVEYDWVLVDGISFSIEICFDHDRRSALHTYLADIISGSTTLIPSSSDEGLSYVHIPKYQAQVSLVSSAGMTVTPEALALTNNGIIFLQDGLSNDTARQYWGEDCDEKGLQFDGGTEAVQRRAVLSATDVFFEHKVVETYQKHHVYSKEGWEESLGGTFSAVVYAPQIVVYDPVEIAEVTL